MIIRKGRGRICGELEQSPLRRHEIVGVRRRLVYPLPLIGAGIELAFFKRERRASGGSGDREIGRKTDSGGAEG